MGKWQLSANPADWRRSSRCSESGCVEVLAANNMVEMRNSLAPDQTHRWWARQDWEIFLAWVTSGFVNAALFGKTTGLTFTTEEWCAFREGVLKGEFEYHVLERKLIATD